MARKTAGKTAGKMRGKLECLFSGFSVNLRDRLELFANIAGIRAGHPETVGILRWSGGNPWGRTTALLL
jgi:hypothetical protein